jgi:zinc protease
MTTLIPESASAMTIIRLDNGLRCILEKRQGTGVVAVQFWVKVGASYEDDRIAGITHYIEHLIFKGTDKGAGYEIAPKIEALGGSINAFTSYDNTVYHIVIPKDAFETGLGLLADSVKSPSFPEKELEKEKKVIIEEIKMGEDDPQRKLFKELFSASYPGNPYGRPIIGYKESVLAITRDSLLSYYGEHYTPDNMALVIVGDFDEQKVRGLLKEQLSGPFVNKKERAGTGRTAAGEEQQVRIIERNVTESYLTISFPTKKFTDPDSPALDVLAKILADGDSSRLQAELKHKQGLVTDADTWLFTPRESGLFVIGSTFKGRDYERVAAGIDSELERLAAGSVEPWELEKAKNLVRASYVYAAETVQGKARLIGNFETLVNDPEYADKYVAAVDRVSAADVRRVLDAYILKQQKARAMVVLLPAKAANPHTFHLDNGLTCVYNRNAAAPSFSFMIGFTGGLKEEKDGQNGSFNVLSRLLLKGTKDLDAQAIARKIDGLAGSIGPVSGRNVFGLTGKFLSKDFTDALGLLKELVTGTVVREDELKKVKEEVFSEMRRRDDEPVRYAFVQMNGVLFEGHPYARDQIGSVGDVGALTVKDVQQLYKRYVTPKGAVLAISGNVEQNEAEALVRKLFGAWKGSGRPLRNIGHTLNATKLKGIEREILQTHMIFSFIGPGFIDEDRYAAEVLDAALSGMGGRIHKRLREENPYAYAVTFFNQGAYEVGAMGIYIGTDRTHVKDVERLVREEIERIRKDGLTEEEVASAKRYMIGNHYIRMQTNGAIVSSMCLDTIYGLKPNFFKVWPEKARQVTKDQVNAVARKYLLLDRMVVVSLGPGAGKAGAGK